METKAMKRRNWIKNIAIIFLIILLILTFFSQTIMNFSLSEVSVQYPSSGTITTRVRGSGTVKANDNYVVYLSDTQARVIKEIYVNRNSTVNAGDQLFLLEDIDSPDLENAKIKYEQDKNAYDYDIATLAIDKDYTNYNNNINSLRNELNRLRQQKSEGFDATELIKQINDEIKQINNEKNQITREKEILDREIKKYPESDYSTRGKTSAQVLAEAKILLIEAESIRDKLEIDYEQTKTNLEKTANYKEKAEQLWKDAVKEFDDFKETNTGGSVSDDAITQKLRSLEALELTRKRAYEELDLMTAVWNKEKEHKYNAFIEARNEYYKAVGKYQNGEIDLDALRVFDEAYNNALNDYEIYCATTPSDVLNQHRRIEDLDIEIRNANEDLDKMQEQYKSSSKNKDIEKNLDDKVKDAKANLDRAQKALEENQKLKEKSEEEFTKAKNTADKFYRLTLEMEVEILEEQLTELGKKTDELNKEMNELNDIPDEITLNSKISAKETELKNAQIDLDRKKNSNNNEQNRLDLKLKDLEKQSEHIEKLKEDSENTVITAKVGGRISFNLVAGETIEKGQELAQIEMVGKGYSVTFNLTNEQASRIKPGDTATPQYYWGPSITAVVESIKNDASSQGRNREVTLSITGDVTVGQQITFTMGERGQNYDMLVPKSAVREDSSGKFVLIVEAKNTPLGNRYTAVKYEVQILAEDEMQYAITASFVGWQSIITSSTRPISGGEQVRLANR